jgi:hypothetical protein
MKKATLAFTVLILVSLACGASAPTSAQDYVNEHGGKLEVYERILNFTDCASLQNEFNQAEANLQLAAPGTAAYKWGIGYMAAADDRMKALDCYE